MTQTPSMQSFPHVRETGRVDRTCESAPNGILDVCAERIRLVEIVRNGADGEVPGDPVVPVLVVTVGNRKLERHIRIAVNLVLGKGGVDVRGVQHGNEVRMEVFGHLSFSLSSCALTLSWKARMNACCAGATAPS